MPTDTLSSADAARIAKRARKLLRKGLITHRDLALLDCLLWSCRTPGRAEARVSYTRLCSLCHMARETVAKGLRRLAELGLLTVTKTRLRVRWALGVASRQGVNIYRLIPPAPVPDTEFGGATVPQGQTLISMCEAAPAEAQRAREALAAVAERSRAAFGEAWLAKRARRAG